MFLLFTSLKIIISITYKIFFLNIYFKILRECNFTLFYILSFYIKICYNCTCLYRKGCSKNIVLIHNYEKEKRNMLDKSKPQTSHNKRRCCLIQQIKALCKGYSLTSTPRLERKPTLKSIHISIVMILCFFTMFAVLSNSVRASMKVARKPDAIMSPKMFLEPELTDSSEIFTMHNSLKIHQFTSSDIFNSLHLTNISVEDVVSEQAQEISNKAEQVQNILGISPTVYLHMDSTSELYWIPKFSEHLISDDDIAVNLSELFNSEYAYQASDELSMVIARIVHRESANQPFIGQILVAEDVRDRLASGVYGSDIAAILNKGYCTVADGNGGIHVYTAQGIEVINPNESAIEATKIALQGSQVSHLLLQASTEIFLETYDVELDNVEQYSKYTFYHYAPNGLDEKQLGNRRIDRVPIAIEVYDHVFYGHWLSKSQALSF